MKIQLLNIILILVLVSCQEASQEHYAVKSFKVFEAKNLSYPGDKEIQFNEDINTNSINLKITGLHGNIKLQHLINNNKILIADMPKTILQTAGIYQLIASKDGAVIDKTDLQILAGEITGKATNYVGPKTTSFNDTEGTDITGYFQDSNGNLVDTTLSIEYNIQLNGKLNIEKINTDQKYYFSHRIKSVNDERQIIGIKSGKQFSKELTAIGSSGCPITASASTHNVYDIADGRQIFSVEINDIVDEDRNLVANGTFVSLMLRSDNYNAEYNGQVINGQVKYMVQNPPVPGQYFLTATSCESLITTYGPIYFESSIKDIKYSIGKSELKIGPILSELNQTIPEGTPVTILSDSCESNKKIIREINNGYAYIKLSELDDICDRNNYFILINGFKKEIFIKKELNQ